MKSRLPEIFQFKKTPGPGFCRVKGCRDTGHKKKFGLCHAHYQHAWRLCYEKSSAYAALRDHARGRGIEFNLSPQYFRGLCDAYGFFEHPKTEFKTQLSVDRVNCDLGYIEGNCRIVTVSANAVKSAREKRLPKSVQDHLREIREQRQAELEESREPF
jgi:hypothetical protein